MKDHDKFLSEIERPILNICSKVKEDNGFLNEYSYTSIDHHISHCMICHFILHVIYFLFAT